MRAKRFVAVLVVALAIGAVWWLIQRSQSQQTLVLGGSGIIEVTEVQVGPQQAGQITAVRVVEGQTVKKGQLLVTIDDRVLKSQIRAAQAGVQAAEAALDAANDAEDDAQISAARAQIKQAQAQLAIARTQAAQARIVAPGAGTVVAVPVNKGEQASLGQTLVTLGDLTKPKLVVYIPEPLIGQVRIGQKATLTADGLPGRTFEARVSEVAEQAEFTPTSVQTKEQRTKQVFGVTLRMENPAMLLKPGMPADAVFAR
jgi:HlyD family secretion protein